MYHPISISRYDFIKCVCSNVKWQFILTKHLLSGMWTKMFDVWESSVTIATKYQHFFIINPEEL